MSSRLGWPQIEENVRIHIWCGGVSNPLSMWPTMAMRKPGRIRAVVALEPASVPDTSGVDYSVPTLIILSDRIDGDARWLGRN